MWAWFSSVSVWVLIVAGLVLILGFFFSERIQDSIVKSAKEEQRKRKARSAAIIFWVVEGILLAIVFCALAAIVLSQEGARKLVIAQVQVPQFGEIPDFRRDDA